MLIMFRTDFKVKALLRKKVHSASGLTVTVLSLIMLIMFNVSE